MKCRQVGSLGDLIQIYQHGHTYIYIYTHTHMWTCMRSRWTSKRTRLHEKIIVGRPSVSPFSFSPRACSSLIFLRLSSPCCNSIPIIVFGSATLLLNIHQFLRAFINKPSFATLTAAAAITSLCACLVRTVAALLATIAQFLQVCCLHLNRWMAVLAAGSSVYANTSAHMSNKHNAAATWELMKRYKYSHT